MCETCTGINRARNKLPQNIECQRRFHLKDRYGITMERFDEMRTRQRGGCAICGAAPAPPYVNLQVDHDHRTGRVRGLLCHRCNKAIGLLGDTSEALTRAAQYLAGGD